ncbi:hypothetical protein [Ketobacter sp.]|nr:MAG: hypothetical protein D6160_00455 [Ketobacter sp.]
MFAGLVQSMIQKHQKLEASAHHFADSVRADEGLPILLPGYSGPLDRESAIASMTQMWRLSAGETLPTAGLVCCSKPTIRQAVKLNDAKHQFQEAIKQVRNGASGEKSRIDKLVDRMLQQEGRRTEELIIALKRARLNQLDLLRCYAKIRIIEPGLHSISWTWAKTHSVIDPTNREEAMEMAEKLTHPHTRSRVMALLQDLPAGEPLAYKKKLPNQLRANLVWKEERVYRRKAVTISGIVLSQDKTLPKYVWRDDPGNDSPAERITRFDTKLNPEPYIKALHLHRYIANDG